MRIRISDGPYAGRLRQTLDTLGKSSAGGVGSPVLTTAVARYNDLHSRAIAPEIVALLADTMSGFQVPDTQIASANGWFDAGGSNVGYPWFAFNRSAAGSSYGGAYVSHRAPTAGSPVYLGITLQEQARVYEYSLTNRATASNVDSPRGWVLQASQDNRTWADVHAVTDDLTNGNAAVKGPFTLDVPTAGRYWRLKITERNGTNSQVCIGELSLFGHTPALDVVLPSEHAWTADGSRTASTYSSSVYAGVVGFHPGELQQLDVRIVNDTGWPHTVDLYVLDKNWVPVASALGLVTSRLASFAGGVGASVVCGGLAIPALGGYALRCSAGIQLAHREGLPCYLSKDGTSAGTPAIATTWAPSAQYANMPITRATFAV